MNQVLWPILGGLLIGLSSALMLSGLGRVTGISGMMSSLLSVPQRVDYWKYSFLLGLLSGGTFMILLFPSFFNYSLDQSFVKVIFAGLLVGFGTKMANGCTSGHGVCGMSRLAKRSIIATLTFIITGIIVVYLENFVL